MLSPEVDPEGKMRPRRHRHLLKKIKNPAVRREAEEDWGRERWR
jgi:hypothetical protein